MRHGVYLCRSEYGGWDVDGRQPVRIDCSSSIDGCVPPRPIQHMVAPAATYRSIMFIIAYDVVDMNINIRSIGVPFADHEIAIPYDDCGLK